MARQKRQSLIHTLFEEEARGSGYGRVAGLDEVGRVFLPAALHD